MRIEELKNRTAIRLAFTFSFLSVLTVLLLFVLLYFSLTRSLESDLRARVVQTSNALAGIDRDQRFADLVQVVASEAASVRDADSIFLLVDKSGKRLAGNVRRAPPFSSWRLLERSQFPTIVDLGSPDDRFYAIWTPVSKGAVLVGANDRAVAETTKTLLQALIWGLALSIIVPALLGAHLALRAQRKIDALSTTLTAVADGAIARRIPVSGSRSDDLEHVAIQINQTLDQLQRLIQNVNQTSSDIAHDLKHPIGRLRQKLDAAIANTHSVCELKNVMSGALKEIDVIIETFQALLRITQIEAGMGRNRFVPLDMKDLLSDIVDVYGAVIEEEGHRFDAAIDIADHAMIKGDRGLLMQLFANLIENAIRHCPPETLISLSLSVDDDWVFVRLCDTGPGIPEAERQRVFQRLYRLEKSRSRSGSGLGLSLVAATVQLHDAKIELGDNRPGLIATIRFPRLNSVPPRSQLRKVEAQSS